MPAGATVVLTHTLNDSVKILAASLFNVLLRRSRVAHTRISSKKCHHAARRVSTSFLGCIECMRYRLLLPMCAVSACLSVSQSVTQLNSASLCWVIRCSLCQITLASCFNYLCPSYAGSRCCFWRRLSVRTKSQKLPIRS